METKRVKITLKAESGKTHAFFLSLEEQELHFSVDGKIVATIDVETMIREVPDADGDYHTKLSDDFYIHFHAEEPVAKADCSACCFRSRD